jgi:putative transposase
LTTETGSLREELDEPLTITRLGVPPTLAGTFPSTKPIESMIEICRYDSTNVKRWRRGPLALRCCAAEMLEATKRLREVKRLFAPAGTVPSSRRRGPR